MMLVLGRYALTFLPAVLGGVVLGAVADRVPRRRVLVTGDVARAGLLLVMAVVVLPWGVLAALVAVVVLIGAPWSAAEAALIADVMPGHLYPVGLGLRTASGQVAQLAGFAVGGVVVALLGARTALGVDAATFAVSAALVRGGTRFRHAVRGRPDDECVADLSDATTRPPTLQQPASVAPSVADPARGVGLGPWFLSSIAQRRLRS